MRHWPHSGQESAVRFCGSRDIAHDYWHLTQKDEVGDWRRLGLLCSYQHLPESHRLCGGDWCNGQGRGTPAPTPAGAGSYRLRWQGSLERPAELRDKQRAGHGQPLSPCRALRLAWSLRTNKSSSALRPVKPTAPNPKLNHQVHQELQGYVRTSSFDLRTSTVGLCGCSSVGTRAQAQPRVRD